MRPNFRTQICPQLHPLSRWERRGTFVRLNWGFIMRPAYPPDGKREFLDEQGCLEETPLRGQYDSNDDRSDDVVSLLEENARLRGLVVRLTGLILRNVADRG
jgi:hypothetical protein